MRAALWGPLLIAALLAGGYVYFHQPFARDGTELLQVPLSEEDPALEQVGDLRYLGGLDIPRMDQNIGGLSGLRWDMETGGLLAVTDDARWVWLDLVEADDRLTGLADVQSGPLLDTDGEALTGKDEGDSEALFRAGSGIWGVSFERDHRILAYPQGFLAPAVRTQFNAEEQLGTLEGNAGIEAVGISANGQVICAQRTATQERANCVLYSNADDAFSQFAADPPNIIAKLGGVPTDADALDDGTYLILFRSYSEADGNGTAIVSYAADGTRRELATLRPPVTIDNFEGLAVREEGDKTFLYIVSDDNFSGAQRTLLMKFEMLADSQ